MSNDPKDLNPMEDNVNNDPKDFDDQELLDMIKKALDALGDIDKQNELASEYKERVSRRDYIRSDECKMCGGEWPLNDEGYCSRCWNIWKS